VLVDDPDGCRTRESNGRMKRSFLIRSLTLCVIIAVIWTIVLSAQGYHLGENTSDALCGAHYVKVDFIIPMYKTRTCDNGNGVTNLFNNYERSLNNAPAP